MVFTFCASYILSFIFFLSIGCRLQHHWQRGTLLDCQKFLGCWLGDWWVSNYIIATTSYSFILWLNLSVVAYLVFGMHNYFISIACFCHLLSLATYFCPNAYKQKVWRPVLHWWNFLQYIVYLGLVKHSSSDNSYCSAIQHLAHLQH